MLSLRNALLTAVFGVAAACAAGTTASANTYPPPALTGGANPNPGLILTFNADGSITTSGTGTPYVTEDEYIEVINNTSHSLGSINLMTPQGASTGVLAFDSDGIDNYGGGHNAIDTTGYGGSDAYFTNVIGGQTGTVDFIGGINGAGGEGYFSLEGVINPGTPIIATPEPASLALLGVGLASLVGLTMTRRRQIPFA